MNPVLKQYETESEAHYAVLRHVRELSVYEIDGIKFIGDMRLIAQRGRDTIGILGRENSSTELMLSFDTNYMDGDSIKSTEGELKNGHWAIAGRVSYHDCAVIYTNSQHGIWVISNITFQTLDDLMSINSSIESDDGRESHDVVKCIINPILEYHDDPDGLVEYVTNVQGMRNL